MTSTAELAAPGTTVSGGQLFPPIDGELIDPRALAPFRIRDPYTPPREGADPSLFRKLAEVLKATGYLAKLHENKQQGYNYISEGDVLEEVRDELGQRGVFLFHDTLSFHRQVHETKHGTKMEKVDAWVQFTFADGDSGERWTFMEPGTGTDTLDKALAKAITGATKYAVWKSFLIPTGDDPDAESAAGRDVPATNEMVWRWGKAQDQGGDKGKPLSEVSEKSLQWFTTQDQYGKPDQRALAAKELERRKAGKAPSGSKPVAAEPAKAEAKPKTKRLTKAEKAAQEEAARQQAEGEAESADLKVGRGRPAAGESGSDAGVESGPPAAPAAPTEADTNLERRNATVGAHSPTQEHAALDEAAATAAAQDGALTAPTRATLERVLVKTGRAPDAEQAAAMVDTLIEKHSFDEAYAQEQLAKAAEKYGPEVLEA